MTEVLAYDFTQRGLLAGLLIGLVSAVTGVFLILRRMAFLGASLSHAAFGSVALGFLIGLDPYLFTIVFLLSVANLVQFLLRSSRIPGDALLTLVFSGGASLGVLVLGLTKGFGEVVFSYLFGSILMVSEGDLVLVILASLLSLAVVLLFYGDLVLTSFNEDVAMVKGIRVGFLDHLFVTAVSLVVVLGVKAVGVILTSSLMVVPALTSLMVAKSFRSALILASVISVLSVLLGFLISLVYNLPPSGGIMGFMVLAFAISLALKPLRS